MGYDSIARLFFGAKVDILCDSPADSSWAIHEEFLIARGWNMSESNTEDNGAYYIYYGKYITYWWDNLDPVDPEIVNKPPEGYNEMHAVEIAAHFNINTADFKWRIAPEYT